MQEGETMKISELSKAIEQELTLQQESATQAVKSAAMETAEEIKEEVSSGAPRGRTGKYARSWRSKKTEETATSVSYVVHANKDGYRLAHLLEFGHAKRGGGRTRAIPHIKTAEERGIREFENRIRRKIK